MKLSVRQVPLRVDIDRYNKSELLRSREQLFNRIVSTLKLNPSAITIVYESILRNVKVLRTNNIDILNNAVAINKFGLKVEQCN